MPEPGAADIQPLSNTTGQGQTTEQQGNQQTTELAGQRVSAGSRFSGLRFPQNTEGHSAWVRITILKRTTMQFAAALDHRSQVGDVSSPLGSIYFYLPQSISFSDGLTYDNAELTGITSALAASVNEARTNGLQSGAETAVEAGAGLITNVAASSGLSLAQQAQIAAGVTINPRAAMLFKAPTFRQLAMNFKMIPSNPSESATIESIIHTLRTNSYPVAVAGGASFQYPNVFKIDFISLNNGPLRIMPFAQAYCTAVTVNFNPTSPAMMADGSPNEVDLTLSFQETKVLDRTAIQKMGTKGTGNLNNMTVSAGAAANASYFGDVT